MTTSKFTLRGLTEDQTDFLKNFGKLHVGTQTLSKSILHLINEKMNIEKHSKNEKYLNEIQPSNKKKKIQFSLLEHDYNNLKKIADSTDTSIQYYIIRLILKDLYGENRLLGNQIEELRKSNYELHKIGVNINQIARALNSGESDNIKIDLNQLNDFLKTHVDYVMGILSENIKSY